MRKKPTPTSRSHSCAVAARSPCAAGESLHSATLTLPGAFQNPLGIGPPSAEEIPSMSPASSRYQRSRSSQTLQDHPEDDPPQGAQPDPETLSDSSLACEILSQQPRNKTWSASAVCFLSVGLALCVRGWQLVHARSSRRVASRPDEHLEECLRSLTRQLDIPFLRLHPQDPFDELGPQPLRIEHIGPPDADDRPSRVLQ